MDWSKVAVLLVTLAVIVTAQRGSRRYLPDQTLEESLSTETHRFKTRSRDAENYSQRGESRRGVTQAPSVSESQRQSSRSRGRTDEPRQIQPGRTRVVEKPRNEEPPAERQFQSRRNLEPERTRTRSQDDTVQRFKPRDKDDSLKATSIPSRSRPQTLVKENLEPARRTVGGRFQSRTVPETDVRSATAPLNRRAGNRPETDVRSATTPLNRRSGNRGSLSAPRRQTSRGSSNIEPEFKVDKPTERILSRTESESQGISPIKKEELSEIKSTDREDATNLQANENEVTENQNSITSKQDNTQVEEVINDTKLSASNEESSQLDATKFSEALEGIDTPTKSNDVELSNRASRRLDLDNINTQNGPQELPESGRVTGRESKLNINSQRENEEVSSGKGRGRVVSRNPSEKQSLSRSGARNSSGRSSRLESAQRTKSSGEREGDLSSAGGRSRYESSRNPEGNPRGRLGSESARGKLSSGRDRTGNSYSPSEVNQQRGRSETATTASRNLQGRGRSPDTESFSVVESKSKRREESQTSANEGRPRYSARIPEIAGTDETSPQPRFSNFRARTPKPKDTGKLLAISEKNTLADNLIDEKQEVTLDSPREGVKATTVRSLESVLKRKPGGNRPRGSAKGPKLEEEKNSGEVSDDDNYPEVYKQLKKSGSSPHEILALLKARKATQENSKPKPIYTQPDASPVIH